MGKQKLLILVDWFEPGFKGGGQIRSAVNLANALKNEAEIFIITGDRDFGDAEPYNGITADNWTTHNGYNIWYASPGSRNYKSVVRLFNTVKPDCIYVNGMFSWPSSILPLLIKRFSKLPVKMILAPRGMLKPSAKKHKRGKKELYLFFLKMMGLHRSVSFHATDAQEAQNIKESFGANSKISIISNAPAQVPEFVPVQKAPGLARLVFIGRIHPVKNLYFLLEALEAQTAKIELVIITAEYDMPYWNSCQEKIKTLPSNISVMIKEHVPHHEIFGQLISSHAFVLPTEGENFGHAIFESFAAGRPVIISDQTPWKGLAEKNIGWDIPLNNKNAYSAAITEVAAMDQAAFDSFCRNAWNYARKWVAESECKEQYLNFFFGKP